MTLWSASNVGRGIITRLEYVEQNPGRGPKGDPGGNVLAIGGFGDLATQSVPVGTTLLQTASYSAIAASMSSARYREDVTLTNSDVSANPLWMTKSANGRFFRLDEPRPGVRQFGAVGDDTAADDAPLAAQRTYVNVVYPGFSTAFDGTGLMEFGPGVYRITANGLASGTSTQIRISPRMTGSHQSATVLHLDGTDGVTKRIYDGTKGWGGMFQNMTVAGGTTYRTSGVAYPNFLPNVKGHRLTGPGAESSHKFFNYGTDWLDDVWEAQGNNNCDMLRVSMSDSTKCGRRVYINNFQAFGWSFSQYYGTGDFGTFAAWGTAANGGGGNFSIHQSALIQLADSGVDTWVFDMSMGAPGVSNAVASIRDTRVEMRLNNTKGFKITAAGSNAYVQAQGSTFLHTGSGDKELIQLGDGHIVKISDSTIKEQTTGRFINRLSTGTSRKGLNAKLIVTDTIIPETFWETMVWEGTAGRVSARGLMPRIADTVTAPAAAANILVYDGDMSISNATGTAGRAAQEVCANLLLGDLALNGAGGLAGITSDFAPMQVFTEFRVEVYAGYGSTSAYRLCVGSVDPLGGTARTIYASVPLAQMSTGGCTVVNNIPVRTGAIGAVVNGYVSGNTLTVTSVANGRIEKGATITGPGLTSAKITAMVASNGFTGTYTIDGSAQTVGSSGAPIAINAVSDRNQRRLCCWADSGVDGAASSTSTLWGRTRISVKLQPECG